MQPDTFDARWISGEPLIYEPEQTYYDECYRNHVVRASFELDRVPERATLAIAVMGYARVLVNGARVDGSELLGWWTNYTKRVYSFEIEVAGALVRGLNTIEVELGNGFFNPSPLRLFGKYNLRERLAEVGTPRVMATLVAGDGSLLVKTDSSWTAREGDLFFNNVYLGEVRDLRARKTRETSVHVWDETRHIEPSPVAPCVRGESVNPVRKFEHEGKVVIDFGVVVAGFCRLCLRAHEGQRVEIVYAETWRDGAPYAGTAVAGYAGMETPRGVCPGGPGAPEPAVQRDVIVCHEGENGFENEFCWHSFRYAVLDGVGLRDILEAQAVSIHTDLESVGHLELDDERFARLHEAAVRTKLNNNHGLFEDCARERFGYGGDMIALASSQMFSFDASGLIDKTLADFACDQTERGGLPETAPFMGIGSNGPAYGEGPLLWQLAYPYLAIEADRIYGRRDLLEREWAGIERFGDYLLGFEPEELAPHCLGDHGSLIARGFSSGSPDKEFVGWCAILWGLELVREAAERLGRDPSRFVTAARVLREQIVSRFQRDDGSFGDGTQTSWAFAAWLGLEDQAKLIHRLAREIESAGVLTTGIFGTMFAFELLTRYGYNEVLERWLLREEDPSLLGMLASGNGALIEMFDDPLASCDHAMFSSYDQWFYQGLGGLLVDRDACGCDRIVIKPYLSHVVDRFSCSWRVPAGEISVSWTRETEGVTLTIRVPDGIEAVLADPWGCESTEREVDGRQISVRIKEERQGMNRFYPHLFTPIKLGDVLVQNRIVANPMSGYFEDRCRGGAGIVVCGHTIVEPGRSSWMSPDEPYAFSKYEREATVARARRARASGSAASIELAHAGLYARTVDYAMGPDAFVREDGVEVRAMTAEMMSHTAACWAQACLDAQRAGFDMVFLHFGHGWLMDQFLSPLFNHRADEYGGTIENRMRFPLQVLRACREAVGPRFPMEMRVSADEWMPGGIELDDVLAFCREAQKYVTSIQVSCGLDIEHEANVHTSATNLDPHMLNIELSRAVKSTVRVPVTLVGSVETPEEAEGAIAEGACDIVALARALAADPQWPAKARDGRADEIVPCLRCLQCYHISTDRWNVGCSVNPRFANEAFVPCSVEPASVKKKVLVVGAGPAGVMAAATAHARGHEVVLAERDETVGGAVCLIAREHHKEDAARYLRYMRREVEDLTRLPRFELRLCLEVGPKTVREFAPDALIVAVGADPLEPPIPGIDGPGVVPFAQAITCVDKLGKNVVIVGGGTIGAELALELAETGRHVRVVEMGDRIAAQGNSLFRIALRQMFEKQSDRIEVMLGTACVSIEKGSVRVRTSEGKERVLACDDVVTALGVRPRSGLVEALSGIAPQTLVVGDCRRARVIKDAVFEGYMAAAGI